MSQPRQIMPFNKVYVSVAPDTSKIIQWEMNPIFNALDVIVGFHIDISRGGEWRRLTAGPITDMCIYIDESNYRCGLSADIYYRVVAVDTSLNEYKSPATNLFQCWKDKHQWLIARSILRKEYLRLMTLPTGVEGMLLKKREHGPRCTDCTDHDTGDVVAECCPACFGTGFLGGYYNAVPYWLDLSGTSSQARDTNTFGVVNNKQRIARGVAFPLVSEDDVWVASKSNLRFIVNKVESTGETLVLPLIYRLSIAELPQSDNAYDIPLEQDMADIYEGVDVPGGFGPGFGPGFSVVSPALGSIADDALDESITKNVVW